MFGVGVCADYCTCCRPRRYLLPGESRGARPAPSGAGSHRGRRSASRHYLAAAPCRLSVVRGTLAATGGGDGQDGQNGQNGQDGQCPWCGERRCLVGQKPLSEREPLGAASRDVWCRCLRRLLHLLPPAPLSAPGGVQRGAPRPLWCRQSPRPTFGVAALLGSGTLPPVGSTGDFGCDWRIGPISPISLISQEPLGAARDAIWCRRLAQIAAWAACRAARCRCRVACR